MPTLPARRRWERRGVAVLHHTAIECDTITARDDDPTTEAMVDLHVFDHAVGALVKAHRLAVHVGILDVSRRRVLDGEVARDDATRHTELKQRVLEPSHADELGPSASANEGQWDVDIDGSPDGHAALQEVDAPAGARLVDGRLEVNAIGSRSLRLVRYLRHGTSS